MGYNRFGDHHTDHLLNGVSDLLITDALEVDGGIYGDGDIWIGTNSSTDDDYLHFDDGTKNLWWNNFEGRFEFTNTVKLDGNLYVEGGYVWGDTTSTPGLFGQPALQLRSNGNLVFMMDDDNTSVNTDRFEWYENGGLLATNKLMELTYGGNLYLRGTITQNTLFDLAESFYMAEPLEPGELVQVDPARPNGVRRSSGTADSPILGVVSANPGFLLGGAGFDENTLEVWGPEVRNRFRREAATMKAELIAQDQELAATPSMQDQRVMERFFERHFAKIALAGRVPVKVDTQFGAIQPGDRLAASPIPGVAMKAAQPGPTLGVALEGLAEGAGTVLTFIQSGWFEGAHSTENLIRKFEAELSARDVLIQSLQKRLEALEEANPVAVTPDQPN